MAEPGLDEDYDDSYEPDPDDYDDRLYPHIPDEADYEQAEAYEEYYEHCEKVHGGADCDCRPSVRARLGQRIQDTARRAGNARARVRIAVREMHTLRVGPLELTIRYRPPAKCGACGGKGWFYSLCYGRPDDRPAGYNGVSLCGCGSAVATIAEARRTVRQARSEPPF